MEKNREVEVRFDETDLDVAAFEDIPLRDLLPANFEYLADRDGNYMEPDPPAEEAPKDSQDEGSCFMDIPPL